MIKNINHKINMIWSPKGNEGKTSIGSFLAVKFAKEGFLTGLIELDRYTASTPYALGITDLKERSLTNAIATMDEKEIIQNFIPHPKYNDLFTMSLNLNLDKKITSLMSFPEDRIEKIIKTAKSKFDVIFLDCPSSYIEQGFVAPLKLGVDRIICILDNDISKYETFKKCDMFFHELAISFDDVVTVINKDHELVTDEMIKALDKDLRVLNLKNLYKIPYYDRILSAKNDGNLISDVIPSNKKELALKKAIDGIYEHIISFEKNKIQGEDILENKKTKKWFNVDLGFIRKKKKESEA